MFGSFERIDLFAHGLLPPLDPLKSLSPQLPFSSSEKLSWSVFRNWERIRSQINGQVKPVENRSSSIIHIVDDDLAVREALNSLMRSVGFQVKTYASAHEFL